MSTIEIADIAAWRKIIEENPRSSSVIYNQLANSLFLRGQVDEAIAVYQDLIKTHPGHASIGYVKIANILSQQGNFFGAKAAYREADIARSILNINEVIDFIQEYFPHNCEQLDIDILDNGCDQTGQQLALLAEQTKGRVVGTNIFPGFPDTTVNHRCPNNEFYPMDGQELTFQNDSFDLVMSLNVMEHVPNPIKYLQECHRVMRHGGFGYFSWYPLWSGGTGHHVHPDMVSDAAQKMNLVPPNYTLDGSSIPYWGHLIFSQAEMLSFLLVDKSYDPALADWICNYIYCHQDLNRWFWRDFWRGFQKLPWKVAKVTKRHDVILDEKTGTQLQQKYGAIEDFQVCGAQIIVQK